MFNWLTGRAEQKSPTIRDTLFGDMPLSEWQGKSPQPGEPWASFVRAKQCLDSDDRQGAIAAFRDVLAMPNVESRQYLQAWYFLRDLGVLPPEEKAREVLGVIVEVGMDRGLDLVAAYPDHHARYFNFSGAGVIWERPNDSFDKSIDDLLRAASSAARVIGPWEKERPSPPPKGQARVNILTPAGLRFGQGPLNILSKDSIGGPIIGLAFQLMQQMIKLAQKPV